MVITMSIADGLTGCLSCLLMVSLLVLAVWLTWLVLRRLPISFLKGLMVATENSLVMLSLCAFLVILLKFMLGNLC